jgi:hypothetical protein
VDHVPALFVLKGRPVLVVGGGVTAYRPARLLADSDARVTVVAPELGEEMTVLVEEGGARHQDKAFAAEDLAGQTLVIAATGIHAIDAEVSAMAQARSLPVDVIDAPQLSSFIIPAAEARAWLRNVDSCRFWEWFFARPIASAVLNGSACKQTTDAVNRRQPDLAGEGAATSAAKSAKERAARLATGSKPKDVSTKFFEVRIPAINALFVACEVGGALMLTSMEDIPLLNIEAGQTLAAQEVIRRARPLSR